MGVLTETMTRLHNEIVSANQSRKAFRDELVRKTDERRSEVSVIRNGFARDLAGAHRAWFGRRPAAHKAEGAEKQLRPAQPARSKEKVEEQPHTVRAPKPAMRSRIARTSPAKPVAHAPRVPKHPVKTRKRS